MRFSNTGSRFFFLVVVFCLPLSFAFSSEQASCPDDLDARGFALLLLDADFSGLRAPSLSGNECLNPERFPEFRVTKDETRVFNFDQEPLYLLEDKDSVEILSLELIDKDMGLYRLKFQLKARQYDVDLSDENYGELKVLDDQMNFIYFPSQKIRELNGCGSMISQPERTYIKKKCLKML